MNIVKYIHQEQDFASIISQVSDITEEGEMPLNL